MRLRKALALVSLLPSHPREFLDRVSTIVEVQIDRISQSPQHHEVKDWNHTICDLAGSLGARIAEFLGESHLARIEEHVRHEAKLLPAEAPFTTAHNADFALAKMCYVLCRTVRPKYVLETGVAYGVTSAFILQALAANSHGELHSVDLPPLGKDADRFVGYFVPEDLRSRWILHRGSSRRVLPKLLQELATVDIFIHDSLHTARHMRWEFDSVTPLLAHPGVLVADDVDGNTAFADWVMKVRPGYSAVIREPDKGGLFGLAVLHNATNSHP